MKLLSNFISCLYVSCTWQDLEEVRTQFLKLKNMSNSGSGPAPEDAIKRALSLQKEAQKLVNDTVEKLKRLNGEHERCGLLYLVIRMHHLG